MANYLCIFAAPDSHIEFIRANPDSLRDYVDGKRPRISTTPPKHTLWQRLTGARPATKPPLVIPEDWPENEPTMIGPEINHRNVDLYHLILNGTADFVAGSGSIFQTWLTNKRHSAIDLTGDNEHFAFTSDQIPALVDLLSKVDVDAVKSRLTQWLRSKGEDYDPADDECEEVAQEFSAFAAAAREAAKNSQGLIWISS
jgi:hypothetical protein